MPKINVKTTFECANSLSLVVLCDYYNSENFNSFILCIRSIGIGSLETYYFTDYHELKAKLTQALEDLEKVKKRAELTASKGALNEKHE